MKTNLLALTLLAAIAAPAAAQDSTVNLAPVPIAAPEVPLQVTVRELADETGLSPHRVRMVVGPHSGYAEYRITYNRSQRQFKNALGEERYNDLMAGRKIELYHQKTATVAKIEAKSDRNQVMAP